MATPMPDATADMDAERARGALLGLAVGDAFGTTHEFQRLDAPPFPELATGPLIDVIGEGPYRVAPGQVTDDTQMACCLATSLKERGELDTQDLGSRYAHWALVAFDIGNQTAAALQLVSRGTPALEAGRDVWEHATERKPAANGSLMRTVPIGVYFATDDELRREASLDDSSITHFDPRCQIACAAFNTAVARGVCGGSAQDMLEAARGEVGEAATALFARFPEMADEIDAARDANSEDLLLARGNDPHVYDADVHIHDTAGFVRVAMRLAFWELVHRPDWTTALVDVVNRGGDADTNAAITGALMGAARGAHDIPEEWITRVLDCLSGQKSPLATTYHPKALLELLD